MSTSDHIVPLILTPELEKEQIVTRYDFNLRTRNLILALNHKYATKVITSPLEPKWNKTIQTLEKQLKRKGVKPNHVTMLTDAADENATKILGESQDGAQTQRKRKRKKSMNT